jgi:hypothetical protein
MNTRIYNLPKIHLDSLLLFLGMLGLILTFFLPDGWALIHDTDKHGINATIAGENPASDGP